MNAPSIRLSPNNTLHFEEGDPSSISTSLTALQKAFGEDWRKGWFFLAAHKVQDLPDSSFYFWQKIASHYLTALCHLPSHLADSGEPVSIDPPRAEEMQSWILRSPPMKGGEYLNPENMSVLWKSLDHFVAESSKTSGLHPFLSSCAPQWKTVGQVCFHLAENKKDPDKPFAFLATYSTGFSASGKLQHLPLGQALKQYSGQGNKQALIKLLTPVQSAAERCPWVQELIALSEIYQPLAWPVSRAYQFLNSVPDLEESGLSVRIPNWWKQRLRPQVAVTIGSKIASQLGASSLLDFNLDMALGKEKLSEEELAELLQGSERLVCFKGQWIELDREKLQEALDHWKKVGKIAKNGGISFIEGMRLLAGAPIDLSGANQVSADLNQWVKIDAGEALAEVLRAIRDPSRLVKSAPIGLLATLRPYQQEGVKWLHFLTHLGMGACLADDMGLGKTLQILALLLHIKNELQKEERLPSLLVVPASLLLNWKQEAEKFTPSLNFLLLHPSEMKPSDLEKMGSGFNEQLKGIDVVVTTYSMLIKYDWLPNVSWNILVLDEAQNVKNGETKQAKAVKTLKSKARVALTGTPVENRLSDLWSLFDFLNPGLLGNAKEFKKYIEGLPHYEPLRKLISPYILRRMKTDPKVISDLPDKIETKTYCCLSKQQITLYQSVVNDLAHALETVDPKNRLGLVLKTLLELKQICNHPTQFLGTGDYLPSNSGKFERLREICEELRERQEKVLVFTQFSEIIPILENYLNEIFGKKGFSLCGSTPIQKRKALVNEFQNNQEIPYFILSIKAGGTGLTLTAANHVVHFDRWWNPAVENQATDRAFRIGQKKNVQVHKFITLGTIEERIDAMIASKSALATDLLSSPDEVSLTELPDHELLNLLSLNINANMDQ
jgi:SNF2 family DNA or RNA helicase